jgi:ribonuclease P protein subunit RPR2
LTSAQASAKTRRILLVCDDPGAAEQLKRWFRKAELPRTTLEATREEECLRLLSEGAWDLAVMHAGESTAKVLDLLVHLQAEAVQTGVVVVAENPRVADAVQTMHGGGSSYVGMGEIETALRTAVLHGLQRTSVQRSMAAQRSRDQATLALAMSKATTMAEEIASLRHSVVDALLAAMESREAEARTHSARVGAYASYLARVVNYPASLLADLENAAILHDIGKIALPVEMLMQRGVLPASQLEAFKPHAALGEKILNGILFLRPAARIVRHHHERWDGSGYPDKLAGENIPLGARILSIADALDAITNEQQYRRAQTFEDAAQEIGRWSGRQFDPMLIKEFQRIPRENWEELRQEVAEQEASLKDQAPYRPRQAA